MDSQLNEPYSKTKNCKFVDIHTHKTIVEKGEYAIRNYFLTEKITADLAFSTGIHPWYIAEDWKLQMQQVKNNTLHTQCCAIGECGVDKYVNTPKILQREIFQEHITLANQERKPLIVHCVGGFDILLQEIDTVKVPVIVHDYSKNTVLAKQLQKKGVYLSVGKALWRRNFDIILQSLDMQLLFLETDDMQIPIQKVYEKATSLLLSDLQTLKMQLYENYKRIFS